MLTGPLLRTRVRGSSISALVVDPNKPSLVQAAHGVLEIVAEGAQRGARRGEVQEELADLAAGHAQPKVVHGLSKLAQDQCEYRVQSDLDPVELRAEVFALARERGPIALEPGPLQRLIAPDVLAEVGTRHNKTAQAIAEALYADLRQHERLLSAPQHPPQWLLNRYNVSLHQALLLRALELRIRFHKPSAHRMRQLFRAVKFHRLLFRAERVGTELWLTLDGPISLFRQSTRYGMALASFLPTLLHIDCPWEAEATVEWTKARHKKKLLFDHESGLVSHTVDRGGYRTEIQGWFEERFAKYNSEWQLSEGKEPIALGDKGIIFPDYELTLGTRKAHLEILGFWRHDSLDRHLSLVRRYGPGNLIVAVSSRMRGSKKALKTDENWIIPFAEVLPAKKVVVAAQAIAR